MSSSNSSDHWQLSVYECQRSRHRIITDDTEIPLHEDSFGRDLRCSICLGWMRNAVATTECLHRFCEECITTALRRCKNECPICRARISSRRSLRRDYRMDILVTALASRATEEGASQSTRATASPSRQPHKGVERRVENQVREWNAIAQNAVGRNSCSSETSSEPASAVADSCEASTTGCINIVEEEANVLPLSTSTLPQYRSSNEQPRRQRPEWPVYKGDNSFTCEKTGRGFSLRIRAEEAQGGKSGACCGVSEADADALVPARNITAPNYKMRGEDAVTNSAGASNRRHRAALSRGLIREQVNPVTITLKPHVDMFLEFPKSPTFSVNVSVQASIQDICGYVSTRLYPGSPRRYDRHSRMHSLYTAIVTGELIALPETMMVRDACKIAKKAGAKTEMYYGPRIRL